MTIDFALRLANLTAEPSSDRAGDAPRLARVERTRTEMMAQGTAILRTLEAEAPALAALAKTLRGRRLRRVVVAGCGDSWFIGMGVKHAVERCLGIPLDAVQALDYAAYGAMVADPETLVIGISAGGNTPAVMSALEAAHGRGAFTIGVSNTAGSPILTRFDGALIVHATRKGWPTQSSTATMALLMRLAVLIAGTPEAAAFDADLSAVANGMDDLAANLDQGVRPVAESLAASPIVLFAGLGPNHATACFGAAKIKELSPIHAMAMPMEEYHHYRAQKAGNPLILIASDEASQERALDTMLVSEKVGGRTVVVLSAPAPEIERRALAVLKVPPVRPELAALVASVPLHLFAYHFAKARDAIGLGAA